MAEDTNSDSSYGLIASATRDPVELECRARPSAAPIRTSEKWWFDDPKLQNALFEDAIENMDHGLHVRSRQSDYGGE
jgi:hypothetical protein